VEPLTCRRGFVSLRVLAGATPPHGVDGGHAEAVVHVAVEFGHSLVAVARHAEQLPPVPRLPLALLVLDDELCRRAERRSRAAAPLAEKRIAYLTASCAENK